MRQQPPQLDLPSRRRRRLLQEQEYERVELLRRCRAELLGGGW